MRRDQLDAEFGGLRVQGIAVVRAVADQAPRPLTGETLLKSLSDKGDFTRRSGRRVGGERKAMKVRHSHDLRALPRLAAPTARPLF